MRMKIFGSGIAWKKGWKVNVKASIINNYNLCEDIKGQGGCLSKWKEVDSWWWGGNGQKWLKFEEFY